MAALRRPLKQKQQEVAVKPMTRLMLMLLLQLHPWIQQLQTYHLQQQLQQQHLLWLVRSRGTAALKPLQGWLQSHQEQLLEQHRRQQSSLWRPGTWNPHQYQQQLWLPYRQHSSKQGRLASKAASRVRLGVIALMGRLLETSSSRSRGLSQLTSHQGKQGGGLWWLQGQRERLLLRLLQPMALMQQLQLCKAAQQMLPLLVQQLLPLNLVQERYRCRRQQQRLHLRHHPRFHWQLHHPPMVLVTGR
jgi:hypothetical protein